MVVVVVVFYFLYVVFCNIGGIVDGEGDVVGYFFVLVFCVKLWVVLRFFVCIYMNLLFLMFWVYFGLYVVFGILYLVYLFIDCLVKYVEVVSLFIVMFVFCL